MHRFSRNWEFHSFFIFLHREEEKEEETNYNGWTQNSNNYSPQYGKKSFSSLLNRLSFQLYNAMMKYGKNG